MLSRVRLGKLDLEQKYCKQVSIEKRKIQILEEKLTKKLTSNTTYESKRK